MHHIFNTKNTTIDRGRTSRRRNGKPASCEPCRKDKVRCDHAHPVCSRCLWRGSTSRCFYPAPLTRATRRGWGSIEKEHASTECQSEIRGSSEALSSSGSRSDHLLLAGYLGPTSFVSVLGEGDGANELVPAADESTAASSVPAWWVKRATEVVGHLVEFPTLKQLILEFYGVSQAAVIAAPFVVNALSQMQDTYHAYQLDQGETEIPAWLQPSLTIRGGHLVSCLWWTERTSTGSTQVLACVWRHLGFFMLWRVERVTWAVAEQAPGLALCSQDARGE